MERARSGGTRRLLRMCAAALVPVLARGVVSAQGCGAEALIEVGHESGVEGIVEVELFGSSVCEVTGFGLAIGHDPTRIEYLSARPGAFLEEHAGRDLFFFPDSKNSQGFMTLFVAFDLSAPLTVPPTALPEDTVLATLAYSIVPGAPPGRVRLHNADKAYGNPPVANIFTTKQLAIEPVLFDGSITILERRFRRGDAEGDADEDAADALFLLVHLFAGGPEPGCLKAADVDDGGTVNLSDAIYLLNAMFADGPAPPGPAMFCGTDPTPDALACESSPACE